MGIVRRHGWWLLVMEIAALVLLWPRFAGREETVTVPCPDIVAGCSLPHSGAQVRFSQQPDALQRFEVYIAWPDVAEVHVSFKMRDMEMGLNRYRLLPDGAGKWKAEVMLPACIQGRKDWLMLLDVGGKKYEIPFTSR